ncbi:MAG: DDE-type integrase/transposase/recombinase [Proteobacteria bacterium]|nr:DDE-type integrase/transposase/recombinase [Pseudomonadota bacterium]
MLNPDPFQRWIGPQNWGEAIINGELTTCLLDNGAQLNFIMPQYALQHDMPVFSLERLQEETGQEVPPIHGIGGIMVKPDGFVIMNVRVPCVKGYNEDQIAIVLDDPGMKECPVILGTPTLYRVMEVIKESEISRLATPWASSRVSWLMRGLGAHVASCQLDDVANKPIAPNEVKEVVRSCGEILIPPFGHKATHGRVKLTLLGYRLNVLTHGLEKRPPEFPVGVDVLSAYATLANGSNRVTVVLRNNTSEWVKIAKGVPLAMMESANLVPPVSGDVAAPRQALAQQALTLEERRTKLFEKLDLSGLETWSEEEAAQARSLLAEYHDLFSLEKHEIGRTKAVEHKIVLKDLDSMPFRERFRRIPPPQVEEVREHLKLMLDAGAIRPSTSPWCNAVVLVRKKDGSLRFCIDFRRLNSLTRKDSHPLPRIGESLDCLAGSAYYSTFDLTSGFWQVPMEEESKQFTAFTLGSMGLFECERMPFGLCNAPATFQRLMQNCLGELNLTYCLIYLDDIIVFSRTPVEHLQRMRVVFDRLREHGLKLKPSKCTLFKTEITYLAHHVSKEGVKPSPKNLIPIAECPPPKTYTEVKSFVGLVGHYRRFIKGFSKIAAPLHDLTAGANKDKKSESVELSEEALEAFHTLKEECLKEPLLAFPDFSKPFLLETDASGRGMGAVLSQKQGDGRYHPIAYASKVFNDTEKRYHSNKKEFLALKWAITEHFHEYLSPYGQNRNEFVVRTDNNPLTYIFSTLNLDATGQRWVNALAAYNFSVEYQKGKDNTVADFLSRMEDPLPPEQVNECLARVQQVLIPPEGVKAMFDNARLPHEERAEAGEPLPLRANLAMALDLKPASVTVHVRDWPQEQKDDPVLYRVVKNLRAPKAKFLEALRPVLDRKAIRAYLRARDTGHLVMRDGMLYYKDRSQLNGEDVWRFVVPKKHRNRALDGCHREAAHQGQKRTASLVFERFWWPGISRDTTNKVQRCVRCMMFERAPPIAPMEPLPCSGPGEILHIDFCSIEESSNPLEKIDKRNTRTLLVMQDHFSKHTVAYTVKAATAEAAAHSLRWGYFSLFGAPATLISDQGPQFTGAVVTQLCKLYGVQKIRTTPYHAQTNGQVERMNQTIIRMIGKLGENEKACWSQYLPELLLAYNSTRSAVTGYSPHYLLFGRRPRIPVDFLFPTIREPPKQRARSKIIAIMQQRLREAFEIARKLSTEEAERQRRYYDRKAGAAALQPGDVVLVRTDRFVGKRKVKDRWEDKGYVVVKQYEDWPVYKIKGPPVGRSKNPYRVLHRNRLLLVPPEEPQDVAQPDVLAPHILKANLVTVMTAGGSPEPVQAAPSLVTRQGGGEVTWGWLNGEFKLISRSQLPGTSQSPQDSPGEEISDLELLFKSPNDEEALLRGDTGPMIDTLQDVADS